MPFNESSPERFLKCMEIRNFVKLLAPLIREGFPNDNFAKSILNAAAFSLLLEAFQSTYLYSTKKGKIKDIINPYNCLSKKDIFLSKQPMTK